MPDVMAAGEIFVDLILSGFDSLPEAGKECFAREFHREIGGGAPITACALARLGTRAGVFGFVGEDAGPWLTDQLRRCGVEVSAVRLDAREPTAFTVVATTPCDRAFFTYPGANRRFPAALAEAAAGGQFQGVRHVHLACAPDPGTLAELLGALRRNGCSISLDAGWHEEWLRDPRVMAALPALDLFFPNEVEAREMTGEADPARALRRFAAEGAGKVALKLGPRGAALLWDGEIRFALPPPVAPVDTTGAGDCFDAGFLHAWLRGAAPDLCLRTAVICGALSTEAYGGISGSPDAERLERELERQTCEK